MKIRDLLEAKYGPRVKVAPPGQQRGHAAGARRGGHYDSTKEPTRLDDKQVELLKKDAQDFGWKKGKHLTHLHPEDQDKVFGKDDK